MCARQAHLDDRERRLVAAGDHATEDVRQHARDEERLRKQAAQEPGRPHDGEQREEQDGDADTAAEAEGEGRHGAPHGGDGALRRLRDDGARRDDQQRLRDRRHAVHAERIPVVCTARRSASRGACAVDFAGLQTSTCSPPTCMDDMHEYGQG